MITTTHYTTGGDRYYLTTCAGPLRPIAVEDTRRMASMIAAYMIRNEQHKDMIAAAMVHKEAPQ
jgi:hypothetical protein